MYPDCFCIELFLTSSMRWRPGHRTVFGTTSLSVTVWSRKRSRTISRYSLLIFASKWVQFLLFSVHRTSSLLTCSFVDKDELNAQSVALQDARLKREKENSQDIQRLREAEREEREKKRALFEAFEASQTQDRTKATQYIEGVSRGIEEADNDGQMVVDKRSINLLEDQPKVVHDLEVNRRTLCILQLNKLSDLSLSAQMEIPGEEPLLRAVRERLLKAVKNRRDKPLYSLDSGEVLISTREHDGGHATILRGQRNGVAVAIKVRPCMTRDGRIGRE